MEARTAQGLFQELETKTKWIFELEGELKRANEDKERIRAELTSVLSGGIAPSPAPGPMQPSLLAQTNGSASGQPGSHYKKQKSNDPEGVTKAAEAIAKHWEIYTSIDKTVLGSIMQCSPDAAISRLRSVGDRYIQLGGYLVEVDHKPFKLKRGAKAAEPGIKLKPGIGPGGGRVEA
jgi:hypothetical protein